MTERRETNDTARRENVSSLSPADISAPPPIRLPAPISAPPPIRQATSVPALDTSSSSAQQVFDGKLAAQIERLEYNSDVIMQRHLRAGIEETIEILKEIRLNCQKDPGDIREENTLPLIVKELADALQEYVQLTPHRTAPSHQQAQTTAIETIFSQSGPWLRQLLERMLSNDGQGLVVRAQVLSSIFERGDALHKVQMEIRESLKKDRE